VRPVVSVRVAVLADTHVRASGRPELSPAAWSCLSESDVILHAGDVVTAPLLDRLATLAPLQVVRGNNDVELPMFPETVETDIGGVRIAMVHDSGRRNGRAARLHRRFPGAEVIVFGHSHVPWRERGIGGQLLFNPGSATMRRHQPHRTMGVLTIAGGRVDAEIITVD
jgi:putative phosphoesterase